MAWFFTDDIISNTYVITGENAAHIQKSLRMAVGEELTLCTPDKMVHTCKITSITAKEVIVSVIKSQQCEQEPTVNVTLFQALTKGDKMDTIVQKAVELGVTRIVPFLSARCVSRPDKKSADKKTIRWQKIALGAAMQSRRGIVPTVENTVDFSTACKMAQQSEKTIIFYECGGSRVNEIINKDVNSLSVFIGSEGGFEQAEVQQILQNGGQAATLGKRILRAETAPLAALSIIMYQTENM